VSVVVAMLFMIMVVIVFVVECIRVFHWRSGDQGGNCKQVGKFYSRKTKYYLAVL
jgi:cobalamin synthase